VEREQVGVLDHDQQNRQATHTVERRPTTHRATLQGRGGPLALTHLRIS
jgi:hypothetical protein